VLRVVPHVAFNALRGLLQDASGRGVVAATVGLDRVPMRDRGVEARDRAIDHSVAELAVIGNVVGPAFARLA